MSSEALPVVPPKPLLRGWLHAAGAVAALITTSVLLVETAGDHTRFQSLLVFGLSMILRYAVSAVYHIGTWPERRRMILRTRIRCRTSSATTSSSTCW